MAVFKSKAERRLEREMAVRKAVNQIKKQVKTLKKNEEDYIRKAQRAKQLGSNEQLSFLKKTLKKTATQRTVMERQLLNIETAVQIKNQAEAHSGFAKAMGALSKTIGEMFGMTNMAKTQKQFETAMMKAESMEERMSMFLDMSSESMFGYEAETSDELVPDSEIDRMIEEDTARAESAGLDTEISKGLKEVEDELKKE